ncbi:PepSY domain-containing protein [Tropicimonas sp. TH_r6]|uniref:PepSY domain-containing protein n=1 Tax=Tropicimonas sp. TH_r6 TaxID=3082085 RepID=UPI0029552897|nr:PepSY domain-containing protein [Tropicimonas sp. TH_r6]MDV7143013.1 PepSY domain-containing protein [Tropicimonas sp. TH_r6]
MKHVYTFLILLLAGPVTAESDHDLAREAGSRHEILPLATVMQDVSEHYSATLLEVELEREHGLYVYEFELITSDGRILEILVDAATGEILEEEED